MTHPQDVEPAGLKLAPCPFCGGEAVFSENQIDYEPVWGVRCDGKCFAWIDACTDTKAEAAEVWNTRASPSPSGDLREAVARIVDPSRWRVLDSYLRDVQRKPNVGYDPDNFKDKASLTKADQIAALYAAHGLGLSRDPSHTHNAAMSAPPSTGQGEG